MSNAFCRNELFWRLACGVRLWWVEGLKHVSGKRYRGSLEVGGLSFETRWYPTAQEAWLALSRRLEAFGVDKVVREARRNRGLLRVFRDDFVDVVRFQDGPGRPPRSKHGGRRRG